MAKTQCSSADTDEPFNNNAISLMKAHRYPCRRRIQMDVQSRLGKTVTVGRQFSWLKHANFYDCHVSLAADAKAEARRIPAKSLHSSSFCSIFWRAINQHVHPPSSISMCTRTRHLMEISLRICPVKQCLFPRLFYDDGFTENARCYRNKQVYWLTGWLPNAAKAHKPYLGYV